MPVRKVRKDLLTSKLVQSLGLSPTALVITIGCKLDGLAWCLAALRGSGCGAGGAGAAELELAAPGLETSPSFNWGPGTVAFGSSAARVRASRGWLPLAFVPDALVGMVPHLHSSGISVCSECPLGRGGSLEHPGQDHSRSGSTSGYLHSPCFRVCSLLYFDTSPRQPGQLCHHGLFVGANSLSPGPVPTEG